MRDNIKVKWLTLKVKWLTYPRETQAANGMRDNMKVKWLTYPREPDAANGVGQHVPQQGREGVEGGEVGVHVRTLPVSDLHAPQTRHRHGRRTNALLLWLGPRPGSSLSCHYRRSLTRLDPRARVCLLLVCFLCQFLLFFCPMPPLSVTGVLSLSFVLLSYAFSLCLLLVCFLFLCLLFFCPMPPLSVCYWCAYSVSVFCSFVLCLLSLLLVCFLCLCLSVFCPMPPISVIGAFSLSLSFVLCLLCLSVIGVFSLSLSFVLLSYASYLCLSVRLSVWVPRICLSLWLPDLFV